MSDLTTTHAESSETLIKDATQQLSENPGNAEKIINQALAIDPNNSKSQHILVIAKRLQGQAGAALEILIPLIKNHPKIDALYLESGYCYRDMGNNEEALNAFKQAVKLNPKHGER